jgi:hypothetical protein
MSEWDDPQRRLEEGLDHAINATGRHRAVRDVTQWFDFHHLHGLPRDVSARVADVAADMLRLIPADDPELTRGLHKLIEAKDCLVRAAIASQRQAGQ